MAWTDWLGLVLVAVFAVFVLTCSVVIAVCIDDISRMRSEIRRLDQDTHDMQMERLRLMRRGR